MRIKSLIIICLAIMLSHQPAFCEEKNELIEALLATFKRPEKGHYLWPIVFAGGAFPVNPSNSDGDSASSSSGGGYAFSGGATFSVYKNRLALIADALYSYRSYSGSPKDFHYSIDESSIDLSLSFGWDYFYVGANTQFPMNTQITVDEWTLDDFGDISRRPSFALILGTRVTSKHVGVDMRFSIGEGPASFMKKTLDDYILVGVSLGLTGGF